MINTANIKLVHISTIWDHVNESGYEYIIGACEIEPTNVSQTGESSPITLHRKFGFKTNAQAKRAALRWVSKNLPTNFQHFDNTLSFFITRA